MKKINLIDIEFFDPLSENNIKKNNFFSNSKRELIIYKILSNEIPDNYYEDPRWFILKKNLFNILIEFSPFLIIKKGGRCTYDFELYNLKDKNMYKIDFKFNVKNVKNYPQIIDLPSYKLGNICFASYYYYYSKITKIGIKEYIKFIWNSSADKKNNFFFEFKKKYKTNVSFKTNIKAVSYNSIRDYIKIVQIDICILNKILFNVNKIYLLYYRNNWFLDKSMWNHTQIILYEIFRNHNSIYYCLNNNKTLKLNLTWKNNTGVLVPIWKITIINKKIYKKILKYF